MRKTALFGFIGLQALFIYGALAAAETKPGAAQASDKTKELIVTVSNPLDQKRAAETIEIPWTAVKEKLKGARPDEVIVSASGRQIPSQVIYLGRKKPQALIFQTDIPAKAQQRFLITKGEPETYTQKTYGRQVPERFDDFAWENDRAAFRMYGAALEKQKGNAKGIDIWMKRTSDLVINKWYKRNDYHIDHGEGVDAYHVGMTLGAGNSAPITADSLVFPYNYEKYKILDQGSLRITFQLFYDPWMVQDRKIEQVKTISLDAGSNMNKIIDTYKFKGKALTIAAGVTKHKDDGSAVIDRKHRFVSYWDQTDGKVDNGKVGVAVLIPGSEPVVFKDALNHLLAVTELQPKELFTYYQGGGWNRSGYVSKEADWIEYLKSYSLKLEHPLKVTY